MIWQRVWQELHSGLTPGLQPDGATWAATLGDRQILLPLRRLPDGRRAVCSLILNQASFAVLDALAEAVAAGLRPFSPDIIVAVPTLGLPLAEGVARRLGHGRMVALGTSAKFWYDEGLSVPLKSITTPGGGKRLYLDPHMLPLLRGKRVAVVDDVLSSGASMTATLALLGLAGIAPVAIGAAMVQGDLWRERIALPVTSALATPILTL